MPLAIDTIYQQDCLEGMALMEDHSVDMILCDLPYGTTACKWDAVIPFEPLWAQYRRVLKPSGAVVLTASQPFTTELITSNRAWFRYSWVWDKQIPGGMGYARFQPMRRHEDVVVFYARHGTYNPQMTPRVKPMKYKNYKRSDINRPTLAVMAEHKVSTHINPSSIVSFQKIRNGAIHPTQKPVSLFEYLIRTYTNEGDTVLDNCMGSGTTAIACMRTGRHFIGFEKDATYHDIAMRRIAEERGTLFSASQIATH